MKSNATPIRCNRDSDSILAAVATSYDFCNTIGTFRKWHFRRPRAALGSKADSGKPPEAPFMSSRPSLINGGFGHTDGLIPSLIGFFAFACGQIGLCEEVMPPLGGIRVAGDLGLGQLHGFIQLPQSLYTR